ncbi:hypothetical protein WOLCODRAFT_61207, partial [Wolfiporia cocos MD-104 SS10]
LTQKEVDALAPDVPARTEAINFLLGARWRIIDQGRRLLYRAVTKDELALQKDMGDEERMVLSYIQAADNQGIWTKHLRAKTQLHQTVLDRCLKQLTQKQIIKAIKGSAKYPTRKIFMMTHLEPSVELTGGPWYTDGELDIEFVRLLRIACLRFIQEHNEPTATRPLYPISSSPAHPTAQEILKFITKSKITETELAEEHVEMLLNVLILDGEIEKARLTSRCTQHDDASSDDEATRRRDKGKDIQRDRTKGQKRKHRERTSEESDSGNERKQRKKRKVKEDRGEDVQSKARRRSTGNRNRRANSESRSVASHEPSSDTESDYSSSDTIDKKHSRAHSGPKSQKESRARSSSPGTFLGGAYVYQAIRQERVMSGWSQAPCARCPALDFCRNEGPVEPNDCQYYGEWLARDIIARDKPMAEMIEEYIQPSHVEQERDAMSNTDCNLYSHLGYALAQ